MTSQVELPSLHMATDRTASIGAVAFDEDIVLFRFDAKSPSVLTSFRSFGDSQRIRAVAFMKLENGPVCLVTAGDNKKVNVFDAEAALAADSTAAIVPMFHYGPHNKKIQSLCTGSDGSVVLSDKFGEVYKLQLTYNSSSNTVDVEKVTVTNGDDDVDESDDENNKAEADSAPAAAASTLSEKRDPTAVSFLLQHFSLIINSMLTSANPRRLITCDRDGHVRVSRYPNTYNIQQYLWNEAPQSPITALVELDKLECEERVIALGDRAGRVAIWSQDRSNSRSDEFSRLAVIDISRMIAASEMKCASAAEADFATKHGVVSLVFVSNTSSDSFGVLVVVEGVSDLYFIPVRVGGYSVQCSADTVSRVPLPSVAVGAVGLTQSSALVLLKRKEDRAQVVCLEGDGPHTSTRLDIRALPETNKALTSLSIEDLDVFLHWRPTAAQDPRIQRSKEDGGEEKNSKKNRGE